MADQPRYRLKHPVTLKFRQAGGEEREESITELTLRRPTAKDLRMVDDYGTRIIAMTIALVSSLSELDVEVIERIDAEDFGELAEIVGGFLPDGPMTGATA